MVSIYRRFIRACCVIFRLSRFNKSHIQTKSERCKSILPEDFLEENLISDDPDTKEILVNSLSNITFVHKDINSEIEDESSEEYLPNYINSIQRHFIPSDKSMWKLEQYSTFLEYRISARVGLAYL